MRRPRLRWVLALAGLAVIAVGVFVLWPHEDRITQENFDRIRRDMSRAKVEAMVGPAGDYSTGPLLMVPKYSNSYLHSGTRLQAGYGYYLQSIYDSPFLVDYGSRRNSYGQGSVVEWRTDKLVAFVYFLPSGQVRHVKYAEVVRISQPWSENFLWRLRRQWHRWFPEK
jgi:hypothetical protein